VPIRRQSRFGSARSPVGLVISSSLTGADAQIPIPGNEVRRGGGISIRYLTFDISAIADVPFRGSLSVQLEHLWPQLLDGPVRDVVDVRQRWRGSCGAAKPDARNSESAGVGKLATWRRSPRPFVSGPRDGVPSLRAGTPRYADPLSRGFSMIPRPGADHAEAVL